MGFILSVINMKFFAVIFSLAVLGCAYSASVVCTDYAAGGGGAIDGYYVRPPPKHCRAQHLGGWRPTFKIKEPWSSCKNGYRKFRNACYRLARGNADMNFRDNEQICNRNQGHVVTWKDRQEFMWIHNNIANQNKWYWVGIFCGTGHNISTHYVVTGEDMRKIGPKWGFRGAHPLDHSNNVCYMWHRNNGTWIRQFHHQGCQSGRGAICKSPLA